MLHKEFFSGRNIPDYDYRSNDYVLWWKEQIRRCREGFEYNGVRVTGEYYFFINFFKINILDNRGNEVLDYPYFSYVDKEIFDMIEEAKNTGLNFMLITARGMGKSYISSALISSCYTLYRNSYSIVSASIDKHADKLFLKVKEGLNLLPTALHHNRIKDSSDMIISGTKYKDEFNNEKVKGYQSKIEKIVFNNEAGKVRGGRPKWVIFEEVGSWTGSANLISCYGATDSALSRGMIRTGISILIGTGGEMDSGGSKDAKEMFYNPEGFNLMAFEYNGKKTALFIPAYKKFTGCYEANGINDDIKAKDFLDRRRELKIKHSIESYEREIQEYPYTAEEAFRVNVFSPLKILQGRLEELLLGRDYKNLIKVGDLMMTGKNLYDGLPEVVFKFNKKGKIQILEFPYWYNNSDSIEGSYTGSKELSEGDIIENLYISGCDSYDQDKAFTSKSKGSLMIFKRCRNVDSSNNLFVAQYTDRPEYADEFYYNTVLLNLFYRSKMLVEYTKIGIINYYKNKKYYSLLWESPKLTQPDLKYSKGSNKVGYLMTEHHKKFALEKYTNYVRENVDKFYFIDQVEEHIEFNMEENRFDRTIASFLCIIQDNEMSSNVVEKISKQLELPYWRYNEYGDLVFR